jgi:hypothetical protein
MIGVGVFFLRKSLNNAFLNNTIKIMSLTCKTHLFHHPRSDVRNILPQLHFLFHKNTDLQKR